MIKEGWVALTTAVIVMLSPSWISSTFGLGDGLFYTTEHCITHKINALDDFVKAVGPAVRDISLCCRSLRHCAAHVVPCSHMGFKHRTRAGAAVVQRHWRGNKQHALSCLEVSFVPMDDWCAITLCSTRTAAKHKPQPQMVLIHRLLCSLYSTALAPFSQQEYRITLW